MEANVAKVDARAIVGALKGTVVLGRNPTAFKWRHGFRHGLQTSLLPLVRIMEQDVDDEAAFKVRISDYIDRNEQELREPSATESKTFGYTQKWRCQPKAMPPSVKLLHCG